jgi:hypothetical protein
MCVFRFPVRSADGKRVFVYAIQRDGHHCSPSGSG